jgi:hypothetical protein
MKKQTKSNLLKSLQSLGIIGLMFFAMAFACGDDETQPGGETQIDGETRTGGNLPVLSGTAWKIDWKRSGPVQTYLFCKSGRWEVISSQFLKHQDIPGSAGGGVVLAGTYTVKGDTLISRGENEKRDDIYKMSWDGSRLKLDDGSGTFVELYEPSTTECR